MAMWVKQTSSMMLGAKHFKTQQLKLAILSYRNVITIYFRRQRGTKRKPLRKGGFAYLGYVPMYSSQMADLLLLH